MRWQDWLVVVGAMLAYYALRDLAFRRGWSMKQR
jgi:hypothetical protein